MSLLPPTPASPDGAAPAPRAPGARPTGPRPRHRPFQGFVPAYTFGLRLLVGRRWRLVLIAGLGTLLGVLMGAEVGAADALPREPGAAAHELWRRLDEALLPYLIPLVALALVAGGFQREVADRTLVYHLVRPISRRTLFLARFLAGLTVAVPTALLPALATLAFSGVDLPLGVWLSLPATTALGVLSAGAVYYLLAVWLRFGTIAGLVYTFAIDLLVRNATGSMQKLSALYYVRSVHHALTDDAFAALSPQVAEEVARADTLARQVREALDRVQAGAGGLEVLPEAERIGWMAPGPAALVLLGASLVLLLLGLRVVSRKDYPLKG